MTTEDQDLQQTEEVTTEEEVVEEVVEETEEESSEVEEPEEDPDTTEGESEEESEEEPEEEEESEEDEEETEEEKEPSVLHKKLAEIYEDPESINDDTAVEYINELEERITSLNEANAALVDIFEADPKVMGFMRDLVQGAPLEDAIARNLPIEGIEPKEGEPDKEAWANRIKENKKIAADRVATEKAYKANLEQSGTVFNEFANANGFSQEDVAGMVNIVDPMLSDIAKGKISLEFLEIVRKGLNYEKAVKDTQSKTEKKVRNEKIIATKAKAKKGDGLPHPASGGENPKGKGDEKPKGWAARALEGFENKQAF